MRIQAASVTVSLAAAGVVNVAAGVVTVAATGVSLAAFVENLHHDQRLYFPTPDYFLFYLNTCIACFNWFALQTRHQICALLNIFDIIL